MGSFPETYNDPFFGVGIVPFLFNLLCCVILVIAPARTARNNRAFVRRRAIAEISAVLQSISRKNRGIVHSQMRYATAMSELCDFPANEYTLCPISVS